VTSLGGGIFQATLNSDGGVGRDRLQITVNDGVRPVVLLPIPELLFAKHSDLDTDGDTDLDDYNAFSACLLGPTQPIVDPLCLMADINRDSQVDLVDADLFLREFTSSPCGFLWISAQPEPANIPCGEPLNLTVGAMGNPPPTIQWYRDGAPIPGATDNTYAVAVAGDEHRGIYFAEVSNICDTRTTDSVLIRVFPAPCP
jgi:hypothetical protein